MAVKNLASLVSDDVPSKDLGYGRVVVMTCGDNFVGNIVHADDAKRPENNAENYAVFHGTFKAEYDAEVQTFRIRDVEYTLRTNKVKLANENELEMFIRTALREYLKRREFSPDTFGFAPVNMTDMGGAIKLEKFIPPRNQENERRQLGNHPRIRE